MPLMKKSLTQNIYRLIISTGLIIEISIIHRMTTYNQYNMGKVIMILETELHSYKCIGDILKDINKIEIGMMRWREVLKYCWTYAIIGPSSFICK